MIEGIQKRLHQTNVSISKTIMQINKVNGNKDIHKELIDNTSYRLSVLEGVPLNAKIALKGNLVPCHITLNYASEQQQQLGDLTVYTSFKNIEPSFENHDFKYARNPKEITIKNQQKDGPAIFTEEFYYLTFESRHGCKTTVHVQFHQKVHIPVMKRTTEEMKIER